MLGSCRFGCVVRRLAIDKLRRRRLTTRSDAIILIRAKTYTSLSAPASSARIAHSLSLGTARSLPASSHSSLVVALAGGWWPAAASSTRHARSGKAFVGQPRRPLTARRLAVGDRVARGATVFICYMCSPAAAPFLASGSHKTRFSLVVRLSH